MKPELQLRQVLNRELKSKRMTINALARDCGMPVSVLHAWVQGVLPSAKNLHHVVGLAKCLNMSVSTLLFDQSDPASDSKVLFNSEFADGADRYRLSVEKIKGEES